MSCIAILSTSLFSHASFARVYDMYRADYPKGAFCSVIAGACASDSNLANGFFQNPAALTSNHDTLWDFDADYDFSSNLEPGMKGDNTVSESQFMGGFGYNFGRWGVGLGFDGRLDAVASQVSVINDQGQTQTVPVKTQADTFEFNLPVSYAVDDRLSVGISLYGSFYSQAITVAKSVNSISNNSGLNFGMTFGVLRKFNSRISAGSWFRTPVTNFNSIQISTQAYGTTLSYTEDFALHHPWIFANGVSIAPWEDEHVFYFDLDLIGPTLNGNLLSYDTFSTTLNEQAIREKGLATVIEPRLGYKMPWYPTSKGTVLCGTYLETSRTEGISNRIHLTGGVSYFAFSKFEFMAGFDAAKEFFQLFLTFR